MDSGNRNEEALLRPRQFHESVLQVKAFRGFILGVHDHRRTRNLLADRQAARQSVHQQQFADTLSAKTPIHGKPTNQRGGHNRVSGEFRSHRGRKFAELYRELRKAVIPHNRRTIMGKDKHRGGVSSGILTGLFLNVMVEGGNSAFELMPIVAAVQDF